MYHSRPEHDRTLLLVVSGSRAYGTNREDSDYDYKGVFVANSREIDGIYPLTDRDMTFDGKHDDADWSMHEISKFCRLAASCNPTMLETLWTDPKHIKIETWVGKELIEQRHSFLSAPSVRGAFLEYAKSQLKRMDTHSDPSDPRRARHSKHLRRLLREGYDLWRTGTMSVKVDDPEDYHEFGRQCQQDYTNALIASVVDDYIKLFDSTPTALPDAPNLTKIHDLVALTRELYQEVNTNYRDYFFRRNEMIPDKYVERP